MVACGPDFHPCLLGVVNDAVDSQLTAAEVTRLVGAQADRLGVPRPSYETVRVRLNAERARAAVKQSMRRALEFRVAATQARWQTLLAVRAELPRTRR